MKHNSSKKIEYTIGLILLSAYIFTNYIAVDILVSKQVNTITLYAFLVWGLLTTVLYGLKSKIPTYTIWYAVFMVASIFTMAQSPEFKIMSGQFYLMIVSFFVTYFVQLFITDKRDFEKLSWVYAWSSLAMVLMLQFTGNLVGSAEERLGEELLDNANNFAVVIMIATMLELWLLVYNSKKLLSKIVLLVMVLYNMYTLALSAGRKFFLLPFVFLYILLLCKKNKKGKRNIVLYTLIAAILAVVAFNMIMKIPVLYDAIGTRIEASIDKENSEKIDSGTYWSSQIRDEMREDAIAKWEEKPFTGYGFDSYKYRAQEVVGHFYYSHCNYVELLYNGGILYFAVYYWIYYKLISEFFKKKNVDEKHRAFTLAVTVCMFVFDYGMVSYSVASIHIIIALSMKVMTFQNNTEKIMCLEENKDGQDKNLT